VVRRVYALPPTQLFGICITALGHMRATITRQDVEQGQIVAAIGAGSLAPVSELALTLRPAGENRTELSASWRARKHGGDRRMLAVFLDSVADLAGQV
jgi:hypothetical protein